MRTLTEIRLTGDVKVLEAENTEILEALDITLEERDVEFEENKVLQRNFDVVAKLANVRRKEIERLRELLQLTLDEVYWSSKDECVRMAIEKQLSETPAEEVLEEERIKEYKKGNHGDIC